MLAAIKIKEEPLDEIEDLQEIFKQEEDLMKQQINAELSVPSNNLRIVEEQESMITVSAADMKSEDEIRFIDSISNTHLNKFKGVCSKCLKTFTNRVQFLKHTKSNHCITKQCCPVCPVTFVDASSMLNHLNLHRENIFFCSQHCGANYPTLPLCEDHELKEHKIEATPIIRHKFFCSFCREGFKTELQLHVHWLQQTQGCGKCMQDVVLHSNNLKNNYNNNIDEPKKLFLLDKHLNSCSTNSVSTIPITKLRLKYDAPSTPKTKNKRQNNNFENGTTCKRLKTDEIKAETESKQWPLNFETEMQIKEEPTDDYESTITSNLIPEVIIKTEEVDKQYDIEKMNEKPAMKNLIINNIIGPESNGKFIPLEELVTSQNGKSEHSKDLQTFSINTLVSSKVNSKIINMNTQNLPVLKIINNNTGNININNTSNTNIKKNEGSLRFVKITPVPLPVPNKSFGNFNFSNNTGNGMSIKLSNGQSPNNTDIKPLAKSGLQIIKFLPNAQIMNIKANNNNINALLGNKPPLVLRLKNPPVVPIQTTNTNPTATLPLLVPTTTSTVACSASNIPSTSPSKTISIKLNSLEQNTVIDAEDFKKLQVEALFKAEEQRKHFCIPKTRLMIIDNIPEKKEIIENMKQQIAEVKDKTTEQIQSKPGGNFIFKTKSNDELGSLFLPILTSIDVELVQARYQNTEYNYKWICPYCFKDYEIKTALRMHLVKAHNLNTRDMEKINVQAKPYKIEGEPIDDTKLQMKEEPFIQDIDTQSLTTSETESLIADNTNSLSPKPLNIKIQKQRYVCNKCGRNCCSKKMLDDHILANCSREPQYACKECPKKFYSHGTLRCHMSIHTGELPHKCNYCDKRFRTRGQVKVHHRTHTGERPFFCQVCSQRFTHRETLIAHLSRHIGMKRYKCYGCDKHFSCISALKTHREIRADTCGKVKFNPRAIGPRVRVIRGNVMFEPQPEINPYLKSEDPKCVLTELQNQSGNGKNILSELQNQSEDTKTNKCVLFELQKTV